MATKTFKKVNKREIVKAIKQNSSLKEAANEFGISERALYDLRLKYGLEIGVRRGIQA